MRTLLLRDLVAPSRSQHTLLPLFLHPVLIHTHAAMFDRIPLTFELGYFSGGSFGQALVAGIAGQSHRHPTAAQEKADLLAARVLTEREREREHEAML